MTGKWKTICLQPRSVINSFTYRHKNAAGWKVTHKHDIQPAVITAFIAIQLPLIKMVTVSSENIVDNNTELSVCNLMLMTL